ncbi:MAG TPA: ABC transporter substrate-binding protein, partial [Herpetosiphonaceae bacterium]|nr:ABC transporter substrate-binding protein [Herpetosiphonaceae bacterium]
MSSPKRWTNTMGLLLIITLLLAACGSETATTAPPAPTSGTGGGDPAATTAPGGSAATGKLEVFSWWTTGGEAAGLAALTDIFKTTDPGVEFVNSAVAGGAGSDAKAVLKTRMLGGDPPDLFQVHMGHELIDTWVVPDKMEPLDDLYTSEGWDKVFPKGVLDIVSYDGHFWSVPANIHRANVLWYNKKVFADNNLTAPTTFAEFFTVAEALKAKGITPLALGDSGAWAAGHLFETVLL